MMMCLDILCYMCLGRDHGPMDPNGWLKRQVPWGPMNHHWCCYKSVHQRDTGGDTQSNPFLWSPYMKALLAWTFWDTQLWDVAWRVIWKVTHWSRVSPMYVGQEYCRTDFTLRMMYDKVAFCLITYLMYIWMTWALPSPRVARAAVCVILYESFYVCGRPSNFFSPSSVGLRALISVCEKYGISHDIRFNHNKCAIMICRGKYMKNVYLPLYTLTGEVIKGVDSVRYLGHIISNDGKDDKAIMRQCQQVYARGKVS